MLRNAKNLVGCAVKADDGSIGKIGDLLFDDEQWVVRSLVVRAGDWLASRRNVLISPISINAGLGGTKKTFQTALRREQVPGIPDVDTHKPVSRQHEVEQYGYYGYPYYWGGSGLWGEGMQPDLMPAT